MFEAGALAKRVGNSYVVPILFGLKQAEVPSPLGMFQMALPTRDEILKTLLSINTRLKEEALTESVLIKSFDRAWPELANVFSDIEKALKEPQSQAAVPRTLEDMMDEVLTRLRAIERDDGYSKLLSSISLEQISGLGASLSNAQKVKVTKALWESSAVEKVAKALSESSAEVSPPSIALTSGNTATGPSVGRESD
jgi:hypothetical protein